MGTGVERPAEAGDGLGLGPLPCKGDDSDGTSCSQGLGFRSHRRGCSWGPPSSAGGAQGPGRPQGWRGENPVLPLPTVFTRGGDKCGQGRVSKGSCQDRDTMELWRVSAWAEVAGEVSWPWGQ